MYPYRIIKTRWTKSESSKEFTVGIRIIGNDDVSIVNNITQIILESLKLKCEAYKYSQMMEILKGNYHYT
jgi:GTP pyrophosphokinase